MNSPHVAVVGFRGVPATWGGIEHQCQEIYSRLASMGFRVTIYARSYYTPPHIRHYRGMRVVRLPTIAGKHTDAALHTFLALCHAIKEPYDIIHIYGQGPCLFSWIPRLFKPKTRVFFTCTGLDWQRKKWGPWGAFFIHLGEVFSAYVPHYRIGVSLALKKYYEAKYNVFMYHIPNGVSTASIRPPRNIFSFGLVPRRYFLWVGRIVPEKRVEDVLYAFMRVPSDFSLAIVGDSPDQEYVQRVKAIAQADRRIRFLGYQFRENLEEIYSHAYAFMTASELEGLPLTLLEAISYGLPCLASDIPPHHEILGPLTNFVFPVGDVGRLKAHIESLLGLEDRQWRHMAEQFQKRAESCFSWDAVAEETACLYRSALSAQ